jgi:hypothetical protein
MLKKICYLKLKYKALIIFSQLSSVMKGANTVCHRVDVKGAN